MFKTIYPNINISVLVVGGKITVFNRFLDIFAYKYSFFSPKIVENCQKVERDKGLSGIETKKKLRLPLHSFNVIDKKFFF